MALNDFINGMAFLLNFMKIYQLVKKLLMGAQGRTGRLHDDLIGLTFFFFILKNRLKITPLNCYII
jgi:hypothetical protein